MTKFAATISNAGRALCCYIFDHTHYNITDGSCFLQMSALMPSNRPKQYDIADGRCLPQLSALCHLIILHNWRQQKNEIARGAYVSQCVAQSL